MNQLTFWERRGRLVGLLHEVAELEHSLCCVYLFAAFSFKVSAEEGGVTWEQMEHIRRWKGDVLSIARQEMEHLAITSNILTALGESPYMQRPNFPVSKHYYPADLPISLHAFSARALGTFLLHELPAESTDEEREFVDWLRTTKLEADEHLAERMHRIRHEKDVPGIDRLYLEVESLLGELGKHDPGALFVGPASAQVGNTRVFSSFPPTPDNVRGYDVLVRKITDLESASAAVKQIRAEGESSPSADLPTGGHFNRFLVMYRDLSKLRQADKGFAPARAVVANPRPPNARDMPGQGSGTLITHPFTLEAVRLFDLAYEVLLRMLVRFFVLTDGNEKELHALQRVVFFPMMTLVIRPLGDMLTQLPAFDDGRTDERAGPAFQSPRRTDFLPHGEAAWRVLHGQLLELRGRAEALATSSHAPGHLRPRLELLYESFWRMAYNFATTLGLDADR